MFVLSGTLGGLESTNTYLYLILAHIKSRRREEKSAAYYRLLPPVIPQEYWTALVWSLLIPAVVGWIKSQKQISR